MDYRFFLTDRKTGEKISILEPVKFDGFVPKLVRGSYYGMTPDESDSEIEFDKDAGYAFLKAAYEKYGVDAEIDFLCEYTCDGRTWEEYYGGQIDFAAQYEERYQRWCRVATSVMANDIRITFLEHREDEIDLDLLTSRGGTTLKKYSNLGRNISLPAKTIKVLNEVVQDDEINASQTITLYRDGGSLLSIIPCSQGIYVRSKTFRSLLYLRLNLAKHSEAGDVSEGLSESLPLNVAPSQPAMYISLPGVSIFNGILDIDISGAISYEFQDFTCGFIRGISAYDTTVITGETTHVIPGEITAACGANLEFAIKKTINLTTFEGIIEIKMSLAALVAETLDNMGCDIHETRDATLKINSGSYIRFTADSRYPATPAKTYLIHETLSRIAEYLTDGKLTVKSDFYGRMDSEVHRTSADGRASLRAITNGYLIRQAEMTDGSTPRMFVSWKKLFDSLQAIDNVGFCFEDGGIIRVEPMEYFYRNDVVMTCTGIAEHAVKFDANSNIRTLKTGYKKWLSGEYNSIDGFHTTREYRTMTEKAVNAREYLSELVADGYAIEATRRRQIEGARQDWEYDNDLFIIDLKRESGAFKVNTGATNTGGTLIDPDTIYNGRLSPSRMAMRHFAEAVRCVPSVYQQILKFGASEGYSGAKMRAGGHYVIEKNTMAENQDISKNDFAGTGDLLLDASPNLMAFKYPIRPSEFRHLRDNPYGLVDADGRLGWIRELEWDTGKEMASFTLILKK